jgi:uncharacterized NAD(P)/FAD-binding protein YdhS
MNESRETRRISLLEELHCDVAIIGAGFSGTMVAIHLLAGDQPPLTVALIERSGRFGRGVAYGTGNAAHLLNIPAAKMSAFPDEPEHFLEWLKRHPKSCARVGLGLVQPGTFAPRQLYGEYLEWLLEKVKHRRERLYRLRSEAVDVEPLLDGSLRIRLANGTRVHADKVVLALGNFPPGDPPVRDRRFHHSAAYLQSPWAAASQAKCAQDGDILILGTGLTTLDLLLTLNEQKTGGVIHVLSRRGLFPQSHRAGLAPTEPFLTKANLPKRIRELLHLLREEIQKVAALGGDWRAVVDSMRPLIQALWQGFSLAERRRFFRHARAYWESHRHRAAPTVLAVKDAMLATGRLRSHRGRLLEVVETADQHLQVTFRPYPSALVQTLRVRHVINCTGPECNYHRLDEPLVLQLFARGLIRPDAMLLGLDVAPDGAVRNQRGIFGQVFTLGSPRKGELFETTAVPELRMQAQDLAQRLRADFQAPGVTANREPDPAYGYEI